jgi:hypothetical protein
MRAAAERRRRPTRARATQEEVAALRATLEDLGFTGVGSQDHELGRETLVTILVATPKSI